MAQRGVLARARRPAAAGRRRVLLVDLEVEARGVVEDQVDIGGEQVGHPEVDRLLHLRLVRLQQVHRRVEMVQREPLVAGEEDLLAQPLLMAVELRVRPQGPVGDHREQGPLEGLPIPALRRLRGDHLVETELAPQALQHVHAAVRLGVEDPDVRIGGHRVLRGYDAEDAAGEAAQRGGVELIGATEVVDDPRDRTAFHGIPDVLGELVVLDDRAVGVAAPRRSQVHA